MNEREPFLQTILERPEADWPRLVYGDWLEERGETSHAELIRVQCELAKRSCRGEWRESLRRRERDLLKRPEFNVRRDHFIRDVAGKRVPLRQVGRFRRGFIDDFVVGGPFPLSAELDLPWDKVLSVRLSVERRVDEALLAHVLLAPWASRISAVYFFDTPVPESTLHLLANCRALVNLREFLAFNSRVSLRGFTDLVCAPMVRGWEVLQVAGEFAGSRGRVLREVDPPELVASLQRIGAVPAVARLKTFGLGVPPIFGPACVQTLLDAPHLTDKIDRFTVTLDADHAAKLRAELGRKFARSLRGNSA